MDKFFFQSWDSIGRIVVITVLAYISLVIILRITGKRTLTKMNAFDFIVTIALGSSFATVALNKNVPLLNGVFLFFMLIILQFIITWLSVRVKSFKKVITSQPTLLVYKGSILSEALKKVRVTEEELYVAARKKGVLKLDNLAAVVMESNGDLTVITDLTESDSKLLRDVDMHFVEEK